MATYHFPRESPPKILTYHDKTKREQEIGKFISRVTKQPESLESSLVQMEELELKFNRVIKRTVLPGFSDPIGFTSDESRADLGPSSDLDIRAPIPEPFWIKYTTVKEKSKFPSYASSQEISSSMEMSPTR